jgi:hypothetical protein
MVQDLHRRLDEQKITMDDWLKATNKDPKSVVDEMKQIAGSRIVLRFGMQELAGKLGIEPDTKLMEVNLKAAQANAAKAGQPIPEEELKAGGSVYEQIQFDLKMQALVGKLINDETTVEELNTAISSVNKLLDTANKIQTSIDYHYEYLSQGLNKNYLNVKIQPGLDRYYLIGIVDDPKGIVERTETTTTSGGATTQTFETKRFKNKIKINAQFAKVFHDFTIRGGLIASTGGVGLDYDLFRKQLRVSTEISDFGRDADSANLKAFLRYKFLNVFYLTGGGDDIMSKQGNSSAFAGAGLDMTNDDLKLFFSKMSF